MTQWMDNVCNETAGFLFRHECYRPPRGACAECDKPICDEHQKEVEGQVLCVKCARSNLGVGRARGRRSPYYGNYYYDPYFYGGYHYQGYHDDWRRRGPLHDPHDFTDADAESLLNAGDQDWEDDMSES